MKMFKINKDKCIGCGLCAVIAEAAIKISDEAKAEILEVTEENEAQVKEAMESCPVGAIEEENE